MDITPTYAVPKLLRPPVRGRTYAYGATGVFRTCGVFGLGTSGYLYILRAHWVLRLGSWCIKGTMLLTLYQGHLGYLNYIRICT